MGLLFSARKLAAAETANPPAITLKLGKVKPRDALAELAKQTGAKFEYTKDIPWDSTNPDSVPKLIDLDLQDKTFWTCLDEICRASNLYASAGGDDIAITI